jgi:nitric oxide reductase large subunit
MHKAKGILAGLICFAGATLFPLGPALSGEKKLSYLQALLMAAPIIVVGLGFIAAGFGIMETRPKRYAQLDGARLDGISGEHSQRDEK